MNRTTFAPRQDAGRLVLGTGVVIAAMFASGCSSTIKTEPARVAAAISQPAATGMATAAPVTPATAAPQASTAPAIPTAAPTLAPVRVAPTSAPRPVVVPTAVPAPIAPTPIAVPVVPVAGDWLGPMAGDAGRCGASYSEFFLQANGSYSVTSRSNDCGGFTVYGRYSARNGSISFDQLGSDCPACTQTAAYSVSISFIDANSLEMNDGTFSYIYHRQ